MKSWSWHHAAVSVPCVGALACLLSRVARRVLRAVAAFAADALLSRLLEREDAVLALQERLSEVHFERLPDRILLVRHGQSEGNEDAGLYETKSDACLNLTEKGRAQAQEAGRFVRDALGDETYSVVLSPFARCRQTYAEMQGFLRDDRVVGIYVEPRVREQEFGNFQSPTQRARYRRELHEANRFYYRRDNGESSADVYDRVGDFWRTVLENRGGFTPQRCFSRDGLRSRTRNVVVVSHGLTNRILIAQYFGFSVETFLTMWNPKNGEVWVLTKNRARRCYEIDPALCMRGPPASSREVAVAFKDGRVEPFTIVDYLQIQQPRTNHPEEALRRLVRGHGWSPGDPVELVRVPKEDVDFIDYDPGPADAADGEERVPSGEKQCLHRADKRAQRLRRSTIIVSRKNVKEDPPENERLANLSDHRS